MSSFLVPLTILEDMFAHKRDNCRPYCDQHQRNDQGWQDTPVYAKEVWPF